MLNQDLVKDLLQDHAKDSQDALVTIPVEVLLDLCNSVLNVYTISEALGTHAQWVSLSKLLISAANNDSSALRKMSVG